MTEGNWGGATLERLHHLDWGDVLADVQPFIEQGFDLNLLVLENLERVLGKG